MKAQFFQQNRERFRQAINNNAAIFAAFQSVQQANDASAPFVQEANFWWLTGIEEPGWYLILGAVYPEACLVAPNVDSVHQTFDSSLSWDDARKLSGIQKIISEDVFQDALSDLARHSDVAMTLTKDPNAKHYDFSLNPGPIKLYTKLKKTFTQVNDCRLALAKLRAIKQPEEIQAIKKAINLTIEAFETIKPTLQSFQHEYQVEAEFTHYFRSRGASGHAYSPIVASGKNACTLHYGQNMQVFHKDALLLLDIGAKLGGYSADITRTYVIGKPTERQKAIHKAVEAAHRRIISLLKPGLSIKDYGVQVDQIMKEALGKLDLMKTPEDYRRYFPHAISHGLGVDVHDALGRPTEFLEGMVLTVEPGIYIPEEGIGVRIEDDILITKTGHQNLSQALPTSL